MKYSDFKRFISPEIIRGERVTLRKMAPSDLDDVYEYAKDPKVSEHLLWSPHPSKEYTKKYISFIQKKYRHAEYYDWAVEYRGKMIGTCGFTSFSLENQCGEIGFVLNSRFWGSGLATEAATLVIKYGFEVLELNRIEGRYMAENSQSRKVMEKCGMKLEGVLRSKLYVKNKFRDIGVCSVLRNEYFEKDK